MKHPKLRRAISLKTQVSILLKIIILIILIFCFRNRKTLDFMKILFKKKERKISIFFVFYNVMLRKKKQKEKL